MRLEELVPPAWVSGASCRRPDMRPLEMVGRKDGSQNKLENQFMPIGVPKNT